MYRRIIAILLLALLMVTLAANVALTQPAPPNRDDCDGVDDPLVCDKGQPGADEDKVTGSPDDPNDPNDPNANAWGSVASQLGDAGVMGAHSSDPVPNRCLGLNSEQNCRETPRNGLGNEALNDATAHGTPACIDENGDGIPDNADLCDTGDHMSDHACRAAAGGVPGFDDVEPECTLEPGGNRGPGS